jgi:hypothetical protein
MSTSGDDAGRVAWGDAAGGKGALKGLAFKAGTVDIKNSSTAWIDRIVSTAAAPGKREPLSAPAVPARREAANRPRSTVAPHRASRWANTAFLAAICLFVAATGWRFSRDYLAGRAEATAPSVAALAGDRARERLQERAPDPAPEQQPTRRADAAPAADRNTTLSASAGAEPAPAQPISVSASAAGEAGNVEPPAAPPAASPEAARLMERARLLLELGDIVTARAALERAAESGSPQAAFALAETYDPVVLSAWGAVGTRGDPAKAQQLYARAAAGGVETARDRLDVPRQPIRGEAGR